MMSSPRESDAFGEQPVGAGADAHLLVAVGGLARLVERHHDRGRPVAPDEPGPPQEFRLAVLERDGVDDALALEALRPASRTLHFEESIMTGTRQISGSPRSG